MKFRSDDIGLSRMDSNQVNNYDGQITLFQRLSLSPILSHISQSFTKSKLADDEDSVR